MNKDDDNGIILTQKKRKRSLGEGEKDDNDKEVQLQQQGHQDNKPQNVTILPQHNIIKDTKSFSLASSSNCFICDGITNQTSDSYQCVKCYRTFHNDCLLLISDNPDQCGYCTLLSQFKCCKCFYSITPEEIFITCEFCSNRMHYHCYSFPIGLMLQRPFYTIHYEDKNKPKGKQCKYKYYIILNNSL